MPNKAWKVVHRPEEEIIRANWIDRVIQVLCSCLIVISLGSMVLVSPFSYFLPTILSILSTTIHNLTVFLLSSMFLFFWMRTFKQIPQLSRILIVAAFCLVSWVVYDTIWELGFMFSLRDIITSYFRITPFNPAPDFVSLAIARTLYVVVPSAIIVFFKVFRAKYLPRLRVERFILILVLNVFVILWLASTNFYHDFEIFYYLEVYTEELKSIGYIVVNPHGWVWFIGKFLGMTSWLLMVIKAPENMGKVDPDNKMLTKWYANVLLKSYGIEQLVCSHCNKEIPIGSRVHVHFTKRLNLPNAFRLYHQSCWEEQ